MEYKEFVKNSLKKDKEHLEDLIKEAKRLDAEKEKKIKTKREKEEEQLLAILNYENKTPKEEKKSLQFEEIVHDPNKKWDVTLKDPIEYFDPTLSYELTGYRPITKTEGLDFNPKDFTQAADSYRANKRYTMYAPGTFRNKQFWEREWDRCVNGFTVGKYRLTGENYFWLNYYRLQSNITEDTDARIEDFPGFINKQYEYFHYLEMVKKLKRDGLAFKARGVGASEIAASNVVYMYTFYSQTISLVTAYLEDYVRKTLSKCWLQLNFLNTQTDGEFRHVRMKIDTDLKKRASKVDRDKNESGWMSEIEGIVHDKPRKLRGDRVNAIYFEEAGSDPELEKTYIQSEALVKTGGKRIGSRYLFGTGGDSGPALAAMNKMFYNPEAYKILPYKNTYGQSGDVQFTGFFIPAYSMWFGDDKGTKGFDSRGVVNEEAAKEYFIKEFSTVKDPHTLLISKAEFCFTPEDAFIMEGSNRFDQELLIDQYNAITLHKTVEVPKSARLSWGINKETGDVDKTKKPKIEFVSQSSLQIAELPLEDPTGHTYSNLYVMGGDLIDADSTTSTGQTDVSSYCLVVLRRAFGTQPPKVVAIYKDRPQHIQTAHEMAIKLCMFYNCKILVEATRISLKQYMEKEHKLEFMMHRPRATANTYGKTNYRQFGVPASPAIIEHQLDLIEQFIVDYSEQIQFPEMLQELMKYSYENKRKFDIVAAFGICLLADEDLIGKVARPSDFAVTTLNFGYTKNKYGQIGLNYQSSENEYRKTNIGTNQMFISANIYQPSGSNTFGGRLYP